MRTFRVKVNGKQYEVEIEEIGHLAAMAPKDVSTAPKAAAVPPALKPSASAPSPHISAASADGTVIAPMPGTVLSITCSKGDDVKKGDVLLVLEAMKMENEIQAPEDGIIENIAISKGQSVDAGDLLIQLGD